MSVLVYGTVALDNVKTPSGTRQDMLGGSAAHFSMSARLFTKVHLTAVVGHDFPKRHIRFLRAKGIDLTSLEQGAGKTFRWDGEYKKGDMNTALTLATELGVLVGGDPFVAHHHRGIPHVFLANIDPDMQMGLIRMMRRPRLIGLDSMNLWIEHKRKSLLRLMKKVDLFVANDGEARALTQESNLVKAARQLRRFGPELIVVKKGEHGVLFHSDKFMFAFPAFPVEQVVDPTGAGDTFAGGLMGYLCRSRRLSQNALKKAILYGTTLASFNVEGFGLAKTGRLSLVDVNRRLRLLQKYISLK